jgi:hypothetical protein
VLEISLDGPFLQAKASEVAANLNPELGFQASAGWFEKFKLRLNITNHALSGESRSMDQAIVNDWKQNEKCIGYQPKDTFNCDETGLYWRGLPDR